MIDRYHLDLALIALLPGSALALLALGSRFFSSRALAAAGLAAAGLSAWGASAPWPWVALAAGLCLPVDDDSRPHPLGRFAPMLTVVALAGIWTAVPDTEAPLASVCVLAPLSVFYLLAPRTPGPVGSLALVATVVGAVWTGSAGWGSALATVGAVGLIATLPLVAGFNTPSRGGSLGLLVAMQIAAGALLPRFVISRSVPVAVGVMVVANVSMLIVDAVALRRDPGAGEPRVPDGV